MGYDIQWVLRRDAALTSEESAALAAHVASHRSAIAGYNLLVRDGDEASADGIVAWYVLRPSHGDPERSDDGGHIPEVLERVLDALAELRGIVPGATLEVEDDFGVYHWVDGDWDFDDSEEARDASETPRRDGGWRPLIAPPPPPSPPRPPEPPPSGDLDVVLRHFATYEPLPGGLNLVKRDRAKQDRTKEMQPVYAAMGRISDVGPLVAPFLDLWTRPHTQTQARWHADLALEASLERRLAAHPEIAARMRTDVLEAGPRPCDRAERALWLLQASWSEERFVFFLEIALRKRLGKPGFERDGLRPLALELLAPHADARCFASFVLELDSLSGPTPPSTADGAVAAALSRIDPSRARPIVLAFIHSPGLPFESTIRALLPLGDPAAREELARRLGASRPPYDAWIRARLAEHGIDLAPIPPDANALRWSKPRWRLTEAERAAYRAEEAAALAKLGIAPA